MFTPDAFHGDRRAFFRRVASLAPPADTEAWREVEARAAHFGIVPGTVVDAQGRALETAPMDTQPFVSEIMVVAFNFPPKGWAFCNGQLLPINQNQGLFSLLGTTFGGDGRTNFGLPNLQGRVPMHVGGTHTLGERGGEAAHTLSLAELPAHGHTVAAAASATTLDPTGALYAPAASGALAFTTAAATDGWAPSAVGGSQAHNNLPPYLVLNFCIALQGIFPSTS